MSESEIMFEENITFAYNQVISRTLPKSMAIKSIILKSTMGALSGGSSGSYIANTAIESIKVRIDGKDMLDFNGLDGIAGQISMGIAILREMYAQIHGIAMTDEYYIIEFPTPIPKGHDIQVVFKTAVNIASIQTAGGDRTTLASSVIDIKYIATTKQAVSTLIPYLSWTLFSHSNRTGNLPEYLPAMSKPLRTLMMITYDGTTLANTTYDKLNISKGSVNFEDGAIGDLRGKQQAKSKLALNTGHFFATFGKNGLAVPSSTVKLTFYAGTAGTAKYVHCAFLCF